jgi:8-oxo-dGTP pyrophosphatase MutT (NUDIX family)
MAAGGEDGESRLMFRRRRQLRADRGESGGDTGMRTAMTTIDKIAWIHIDHGKILSTRSRGKDVYYIPGGKREAGETDLDTLVREIDEELAVTIDPATARHLGTFHAQAHGHAEGVTVKMTCYTADHHGTPTPSSEIEEMIWLSYRDRDRVSPVDQIIFDHLRQTDQLR